MSQEELSLDAAPAAEAAEAQPTADAGSDPNAERAPEATGEEAVQQPEGAEPGAEETQQVDPDAAPAAEIELPEGFESVEDLVAAYNEQKAALDGQQRPSPQAREERPEPTPQPRRSRFEGWKQDDWVKGLQSNPQETIGEAAIEHLERSGAGHDLINTARESAVKEVLQKLSPLVEELVPLIHKRQCDRLETEYPAFPEYRKQVESILDKKGGNARTVFLDLLARTASKSGGLGKKISQASGVLKGKARVAAAAQAGGVRPASAVKPAAQPAPDALDRLTGPRPKKVFSVE